MDTVRFVSVGYSNKQAMQTGFREHKKKIPQGMSYSFNNTNRASHFRAAMSKSDKSV